MNQNLSPFMNKLHYFCRVLKRQGYIDKVTIFKGVIKITSYVDGRSVVNVIGHKSDLEKLFPGLDDIVKADVEARVL